MAVSYADALRDLCEINVVGNTILDPGGLPCAPASRSPRSLQSPVPVRDGTSGRAGSLRPPLPQHSDETCNSSVAACARGRSADNKCGSKRRRQKPPVKARVMRLHRLITGLCGEMSELHGGSLACDPSSFAVFGHQIVSGRMIHAVLPDP